MYFLGKIRWFENFHFLVDSALDSDRRPKNPNRLLQLIILSKHRSQIWEICRSRQDSAKSPWNVCDCKITEAIVIEIEMTPVTQILPFCLHRNMGGVIKNLYPSGKIRQRNGHVTDAEGSSGNEWQLPQDFEEQKISPPPREKKTYR